MKGKNIGVGRPEQFAEASCCVARILHGDVVARPVSRVAPVDESASDAVARIIAATKLLRDVTAPRAPCVM